MNFILSKTYNMLTPRPAHLRSLVFHHTIAFWQYILELHWGHLSDTRTCCLGKRSLYNWLHRSRLHSHYSHRNGNWLEYTRRLHIGIDLHDTVGNLKSKSFIVITLKNFFLTSLHLLHPFSSELSPQSFL